jgi:hypothetical protein
MPKLGTRSRTIILAGGVTAILAAPIAGATGEGQPLDGGARNPDNNQSRNYTRETEIIANVGSYGTRQSNKSDNGGGAVYGCRSKAGGTPKGNEPCLRATNLADGYAFELNTNGGLVGGVISVGNGGDTRKPFTTNATGVADGLNADRVDGKNADDFVPKSDAANFAQAGDFLFAAVTADGNVAASRGGTASASFVPATNTYTVTFPKDVSKCSFTATENSNAASDVDFAVNSAGGTKVQVDETDGGTAVPFHLQVIC